MATSQNSTGVTASTETLSTTHGALLNINMQNITKLNTTNYIMWRNQIHALLDGYDMAHFLDGSKPVPDATITVDGAVIPDPAHALYQRQDRLIYSALIGALSHSVQPLVSRATTTAQVWATLASTYAKPSRGHIKQLKYQIKQWKKGTKTIDEYFQGLTTRFDQLAMLGKVIDHEDQIEYVLEGLPEEYKSLVDQIEGRDNPPTLTELHEKLLNHDVKVITQGSIHYPITANAASNRPRNNNNNHVHRNTNNHVQPWQPQPRTNFNSNYRAPRPYLGKCQICGVQGHSARRCSQFVLSNPAQVSPVPWQPRAHFVGAQSTAETPWLLDSGATHHISSDLANLALHQPYTGGEEVIVGNGAGLSITHMGNTTLPSKQRLFSLTNVLHVPKIKKNLISVYKLCNTNDVSVEFFPSRFQVKDLNTGDPLLQGHTKDELYEWPVSPTYPSAYITTTPNTPTTVSDWHSRLGHPSFPLLKTMITKFSLPVSNSMSSLSSCTNCLSNKSHKHSFSQSTIVSTKPLEILFTDVWTSPIISVDNFKYYLVIVDHFSRYTWLYPLKLKSQVKETFVRFTKLVENRFQTKIQTLFSDNGGEFVALRDFLSTKGIGHLTSPPHTPEHNGLAERKHRHLVETGLTLLSQAHLPNSFWTYALATAAYLINRMPTPVLSNQSQYHKLFQTEPNYTKLRIFGSLCFPWLRPYASNKLEPRSKPCVFLGYSLTQSAYLCLDPLTNRLYVSRHVRFDETKFPFQSLTVSNNTSPSEQHNLYTPPVTFIPTRLPLIEAPSQPETMAPPRSDSAPDNTTPLSPSAAPAPAPNSALSPPSPPPLPPTLRTYQRRQRNTPCRPPLSQTAATTNTSQSQSLAPNTHPSGPNTNCPNITPSTAQQGPQTTQSSQTSTSTPSASTSQPPTPQNQDDNPEPANRHPMKTRSKNQITKPNNKFLHLTTLSSLHHREPRTLAQALKDEKWRGAMATEFDAQLKNQTWNLIPPASHQNLVGNKWIFRTKYLPDGSLDKYKARLVAKGFTQQPGVDYRETFSPVIKSTTVRLVLKVAVRNKWCLRQIDVNNAFLQGSLNEDVYMAQPQGFVDPERPSYVCHLKKALYGLKQAPRAWYLELKQYLVDYGFKNSVSDTSLFVLSHNNNLVYILVYVDDIIVTGNNTELVEKIIDNLARRFSVKDLGDLSYFLGLEATRSPKGLHLNQRKYTLDLLHRLQMTDAKPVATPMATEPKLTLSGEKYTNPTEYRALIGSLQYLAFTRPDIAFAVNRLSQFMHSPTNDHWQAAKRVLRYLAGTPTHGLFFSASGPLTVHAFSDADWAGDADNFLSTYGYIVYLGDQPISWSSKKQKTVARSSTEAEYRSVANTAAEVNWVCSLLTELGLPTSTPPVIYCDNIGATYVCANPVYHSRMKHIALDYHFIREQIQAGRLRVSYVSTNDQLADTLTKPLNRSNFLMLRNKIGVASPLPS